VTLLTQDLDYQFNKLTVSIQMHLVISRESLRFQNWSSKFTSVLWYLSSHTCYLFADSFVGFVYELMNQAEEEDWKILCGQEISHNSLFRNKNFFTKTQSNICLFLCGCENFPTVGVHFRKYFLLQHSLQNKRNNWQK